MQINIPDPQTQTLIFEIIFFALLLVSFTRKSSTQTMSKELTADLKGFAILAVIFSHVGYFLSSDDRFLFPLSILAGVGVNLFLFLSGFGLTISAISKPLTIFGFYKKRLSKLFFPMWLTITSFIILDFFIFQKTYPVTTLIQNYLGFFPEADIFSALDSPLWYFTLIFFYYLIFPILFWKKTPFLSASSMLVLGFLILKLPLPLNPTVLDLYKLHFISFPLGVFFAQLIYDQDLAKLKNALKHFFIKSNLKYLSATFFMLIFFYTSFNSGVGLSKVYEQTISLITTFSVLFLFIVTNWRFKLLGLFGKYSYEIYLIHWPLMARFGFLYIFLPASFATALYLVIFLGIGNLMQKLEAKFKLW